MNNFEITPTTGFLDVEQDQRPTFALNGADDPLFRFNQMASKYDGDQNATQTFIDVNSPTEAVWGESKYYKDWYSENSVNKQKLAFTRKYKPSFKIPLLNFGEDRDSDN